MTKSDALLNFWSRFGIPAYYETHLPEKPEYPYITFEAADDSFGNTLYLSASLWYRGKLWTDANAKAEEISRYIGRDGVYIDFDNGSLYIQRGSPFSQNMGDDFDEFIKRKALQIEAEYLTED